MWLQQEREKNGLKVRKVPGERNPADLGTTPTFAYTQIYGIDLNLTRYEEKWSEGVI